MHAATVQKRVPSQYNYQEGTVKLLVFAKLLKDELKSDSMYSVKKNA